MSREIFGHGVAGELFVEDPRPDGSVILLECITYSQRSPSSGTSGVTVSSSGGSWPVMQEGGMARKRRGKLHLDTTQNNAWVNTATSRQKQVHHRHADSGLQLAPHIRTQAVSDLKPTRKSRDPGWIVNRTDRSARAGE
jgi:hypothetical protein